MADAYRLKALLKIRGRARQDAEAELGRHQQLVTRAQNALEAAQRFAQKASDKVEEAKANLYTGEGLTIALIQGREAFVQRLGIELDDAHEAVARCEDEVTDAQEGLRQANVALVAAKTQEEALLKHRERWLDEQKKIDRRRAEDAADDVAQSLWLRKKKDR
jgi:flagellar biosynthesis chaperone FliJ